MSFGTGFRYKAKPWPVSDITGRCQKSFFQETSPGKKYVLVIGNSHLRSLVDGNVAMPEGCLRFGFLSNPGACATVLRKEVMAAKVEVEPDLVCLMAPCNTGRITIEEAGREFGKLILSAVERWPNDLDYQEMLRQEYNRVAVRFKVRYISTAAQFPVKMTELWCRDGVHLSDETGMARLVDLIWIASYLQLEGPPPSLPQPPRKPAPPAKTFIPTLVVTGEVRVPRGKSSHDWTEVTSGMRKTTAEDFQGLLRVSILE
ncbi:hypothetical protein SKAU_G00095260 [Synaphobranchus kaupii]|uniref:Uncharacterized protein n=1 Tax=Synaphobranchus kaupii TaxID=118154 RepID=A0A9Q1J6X0_SYNKA|nr:hypothetical protein SKAU_G00095260 [Synaphobranchus kaupii]